MTLTLIGWADADCILVRNTMKYALFIWPTIFVNLLTSYNEHRRLEFCGRREFVHHADKDNSPTHTGWSDCAGDASETAKYLLERIRDRHAYVQRASSAIYKYLIHNRGRKAWYIPIVREGL